MFAIKRLSVTASKCLVLGHQKGGICVSRTFSSAEVSGPLTGAQEVQWREKGYVVAGGLLDPHLVQECTQIMDSTFMAGVSKDFGSDGRCEFPTCNALDKIVLHDNVLDGVTQLLKTSDILLTQSDGWCKAGHKDFGPQQNNDQRFHMDYGNNTWLHPTPWYEPENVAIIVYLADTEQTGGGTAVCPREGNNDELYMPPYINMPGYAGHTFYNDSSHAEQYFRDNHPEVADFRSKIYSRQIVPIYKPGDVLFYRYDVWHRGTPVNVGHKRSVINLAFKKRDSFWHLAWNPAWTKRNYYGKSEGMLIKASPKQRAVIGVPKPGHEYWNEERIRLFGARYPGIDLTPYLEKLQNNRQFSGGFDIHSI